VALVAIGLVLQAFGYLRPSGVDIGSLRWQPVFFAGIALVLGVQALLAGAVLAHQSAVTASGLHRRFEFVGRPSFSRRCLTLGVLMMLAGLAIDFVLFFVWLSDESTTPIRSFNNASLAQSLIIVGGTLASFGVVSRFQRARAIPRRADRYSSRDAEPHAPDSEPIEASL
jgi:uncharacterized membrane protein YidH (DUF202 family)